MDDYDEFDYEDFVSSRGEKEYGPDPRTQRAKEIILQRLKDQPERVYFQRQLEVIHEKSFFHWVTDRAIRELSGEGKIAIHWYPISVGGHRDKLKMITLRTNRYFKTEAKAIASLVEEYSAAEVTRDMGYWCQELFKVAYARHDFKLLAEDVNEFEGKKWEKSGKDLDFIVEKNGKRFGCEVKNTLGYIEKAEMEEKLEMCHFFGVVPIFILRYSPTVWNNEIFEKKGLVQIFETQVFSPGRSVLVNRIKDELEMPVLVSKAIPDSIMNRLEKVLVARVFNK